MGERHQAEPHAVAAGRGLRALGHCAGCYLIHGLAIALAAYALKMVLLAVLLAVLESSVAKLRMYLVPDFLGVACALSILAVVFTALKR